MNGDGTVNLAHSKNITGGNVVVQNPTYCFRALAFPFGSIIATSDLADGGANATASAAIGAPRRLRLGRRDPGRRGPERREPRLLRGVQLSPGRAGERLSSPRSRARATASARVATPSLR